MARILESEASTFNAISTGTIIKGNISANSDFRMDGQLEGNITVNGKLAVGQTGVITGDIVCQNALIDGTVNGNISVKELLELTSTARVKGDILINQIAITPGASFSGTCRMIDEIRKENSMEAEQRQNSEE